MTINFPKRKRPLIFAAILLAMIGFGWWRAAAPPAFADFVYKAGGKVRFIGTYRTLYYDDGGRERIVYQYATNAPVSKLVSALGDHIGEDNVTFSRFASYVYGSLGELNYSVQPLDAAQTYVTVSVPLEVWQIDQLIADKWLGWFDLRYGKRGGPNVSAFNPIGLIAPPINISEIRKLHPRMKVEVGP